jgi:hypothetical protein
MSWFIGKKTFIVSILMFSVSLFNLITGDISLYEFIYMDLMKFFVDAMGLSAIRAGV